MKPYLVTYKNSGTRMDELHRLKWIAKKRGMVAMVINGQLLVWCGKNEYIEIRNEKDLNDCHKIGVNDNAK